MLSKGLDECSFQLYAKGGRVDAFWTFPSELIPVRPIGLLNLNVSLAFRARL